MVWYSLVWFGMFFSGLVPFFLTSIEDIVLLNVLLYRGYCYFLLVQNVHIVLLTVLVLILQFLITIEGAVLLTEHSMRELLFLFSTACIVLLTVLLLILT